MTARPWPIGRLPIEEPEYCGRGHDARRLAGQVDAGRLAEAERAHPLVEAVRCRAAGRSSPPRCSTTARGSAPRVSVSPAPRLGLVDGAVGHLELGRQGTASAGDHAVLQRARDGHRLERRARLVGRCRPRGSAARSPARCAGIVGVDARPVGQREDLAAARVHHHRRGALGLVGLPDAGEHRLGALLDRGVERQAQVRPGTDCFFITMFTGRPSASFTILLLAVGPVQAALEATARARESGVVGARPLPITCDARSPPG